MIILPEPPPQSLLETLEWVLRDAGWSHQQMLVFGDVLLLLAVLSLVEFVVILLLASRLVRRRL